MNIQEEAQKIHAQFGTSEMANYKIQLMCEQYANEKVKEIVKEIQSQATDGPLRGNWIGFKAYL